MTRLRVLFNAFEPLSIQDVFPKLESPGIDAISLFGDIGCEALPSHFREVTGRFRNVNVNLFHGPTCLDEEGWKDKLKKDCQGNASALAELGINNYPWVIGCNLYGHGWDPQVSSFVHRNRLVGPFNCFYECAHDANLDADFIIVPCPHPRMNLN